MDTEPLADHPEGSEPVPSVPSNGLLHSRAAYWIAPLVLILLIGAGAAAYVFLKHSPIGTLHASVAGGYGCPPVPALSVADFTSAIPPTVWEKAAKVPGTNIPVLIPQGDETPDDQILLQVGVDTIVKSPIIQDPQSLRVYFTRNFNLYAVDRYHVYFIHTPKSVSVNSGSQIVTILPEVDPNTVQFSSDYYYISDANHLYYLGLLVPEATPGTFKVLQNGYALVLTPEGNWELLNGEEHGILDPDVLPKVTQLTPLEALYIKGNGTINYEVDRTYTFTDQRVTPLPDTAQVRIVSTTTTPGQVRSYIPTVYGIFAQNDEQPLVCFAAGDYSISDLELYKSHLLLSTKSQSRPVIKDVDLSTGSHSVSGTLPLGDGGSQIIFDKSKRFIFTIVNDSAAVIQKIALDDAISELFTGTPVFTKQDSGIDAFVLAPSETQAAAIESPVGADFQSTLVLIDFASGSEQAIGPANKGLSTRVPLLFSLDERKLYYWNAPYESFDAGSPFMSVHPLAAGPAELGSAAENTPIPLYRYLLSPDQQYAYYWHAKGSHRNCTYWSDDTDDYSDTITSFDLNSQAEKDLYTAPAGMIFDSVKQISDHSLSVDLHSEIATTSNTSYPSGTPPNPCVIEGKDAVTKTIAL